MLGGNATATFEVSQEFKQLNLDEARALQGRVRIDVEKPDGTTVLVREFVKSSTEKDIFDIKLIDGFSIPASQYATFRVATDGRTTWKSADKLKLGSDAALCSDGIYRRVMSREKVGSGIVYNLNVNDRDNVFVSNGIVIRGA